jgi:hypothetical protein
MGDNNHHSNLLEIHFTHTIWAFSTQASTTLMITLWNYIQKPIILYIMACIHTQWMCITFHPHTWMCITFHPHTMNVHHISSTHNECASHFIHTAWYIDKLIKKICYIIGAWISNEEETRQLVYAYFLKPSFSHVDRLWYPKKTLKYVPKTLNPRRLNKW